MSCVVTPYYSRSAAMSNEAFRVTKKETFTLILSERSKKNEVWRHPNSSHCRYDRGTHAICAWYMHLNDATIKARQCASGYSTLTFRPPDEYNNNTRTIITHTSLILHGFIRSCPMRLNQRVELPNTCHCRVVLLEDLSQPRRRLLNSTQQGKITQQS
jgi:hypothetical protein